MVKKNDLLVYILAVGVFGILNTEMGFIGILPFIAVQFDVSIVEAGMLVSLFALGVAIAGPTMPLLFSGINRKAMMLLVIGIFILGNVVSIFASNFTTLLLARVIPAFFHPIYCSMAFSIAASSVEPERAPKAVAKIMVGVSAGMVLRLLLQGRTQAKVKEKLKWYPWIKHSFVSVQSISTILVYAFILFYKSQ